MAGGPGNAPHLTVDVAGLWPLRGAQGLDPCGKCKAARPLNAALGYGLGGPEGVGLVDGAL